MTRDEGQQDQPMESTSVVLPPEWWRVLCRNHVELGYRSSSAAVRAAVKDKFGEHLPELETNDGRAE